MRFPIATIFAVVLLMGASMPAGAYALLGRVYVSPSGSDSNTCLTVTSPCKTITHAASVSGGAAWDVVPASGTYNENVSISKSGSSVAPLRIVPSSGSRVYIDGTGKGPIGVEVTGNYVNMTGMYIQNFSGDCVYVHGSDATHHQVNLHLDLMGTLNCGGYVVHAEHTTLLDDGYGRIFNGKKGPIYLNDSPMFHIHDQNIYNLPEQGYPSTVGALITSSPNGNFEGVNGKISGVSPTLDAESSPYMSINNNNPPPPLSNTFTCTINPLTDRATDVISGNGSGCQ
jgi:hypothetical protein